MFHAWSTSNAHENVRSGDSLTLSNSNLKFHTVVVFMLFMFDDVVTVTAIVMVFSSLIHLFHLIFEHS